MSLKNNYEIVGNLYEVYFTGNQTILSFTFSKNIIIPKNSIDVNILYNCLGKHVGIFRFDNKYLIRTISDKKEVENRENLEGN